jgi:hypothetical protein
VWVAGVNRLSHSNALNGLLRVNGNFLCIFTSVHYHYIVLILYRICECSTWIENIYVIALAGLTKKGTCNLGWLYPNVSSCIRNAMEWNCSGMLVVSLKSTKLHWLFRCYIKDFNYISDRAVQSNHTRELSWINHSSFGWGAHWRLNETFTRSNTITMG